MKTLITLLAIFFISISSFAQQGINYKAVIKDDNGNALVSTDLIAVQFIIYKGAALTENVYQETHAPTTDENGVIIVNIGAGTTTDVFKDIDWDNDDHFLNVQVNTGSGMIDMGTTQFMAVPYAITAGNVSGLEAIDEGWGIGWRLKGFDSANYGNIGLWAIDLSNNSSSTNPRGATGDYSLATGFRSLASGIFSTAMGRESNALGQASVAMGNYTTAIGKDEVAIGVYNTLYEPVVLNSPNDINPNRLFVIGNGRPTLASPNARSDAFIVRGNGVITAPSFSIAEINDTGDKALITKEYADDSYLNTVDNVTTGGSLTIQNVTDATSSWRLETRPNGSLSLYRNGDYRGFFSESTGVYSSISDRRTKKDITSLENGILNKVIQLHPVSYLMKDQTDTQRTLGLISQEVKEIFPSLTTYVEEADLITLSYTELIPILIKALQEQQIIIEAQKAKDVIQDQSIEDLVVRLNLLESKSSN